jgi:amino acid transporter
VIGTVIVVGALTLFAEHQPVGFLLERAPPKAGLFLPGFLVGLLQAAWTFTGYDASAHAAEETKDAARAAPRGILTAIVASAIAGYAMLIAITLAIPELGATIEAKNPFIYVLETSLGRLGTALVWLAVGAMWFCGLASVTSNSRMLYAFARDGGLPASKHLARVSEKWKTPHIGIWVSVSVAFVLAIFADALSVMAALSTVALYASYGLPVLLALLARKKGWPRVGPWTLGNKGAVINVIAVVWIAFMVVVMSLPPNGLAGITLLSTCALLALAWYGGVRRVFTGPKVNFH